MIEARRGQSSLQSQSASLERSEPRFRKLRPGPGRTQEEVAAHQRARILEAMIEIVAERGYPAVTVRDLAKLAGVSTRAFYKQFADKQECFLEAYDAIVRAAGRRVLRAGEVETDRRRRLCAGFRAFGEAVVRHQKPARLALVEAPSLGPEAAERAQRGFRLFEAMIRDAFRLGPDPLAVLPLLAKGIVGGAFGLAGSRLLTGREDELPQLTEELSDWALVCCSPAAMDRAVLEPRADAVALGATVAAEADDVEGAEEMERRLILSAVAKLVSAEGFEALTRPRISAAAGVSRRRFSSRFDNVEDCFLEAVELFTGGALDRAFSAGETSTSWAAGINRGVTLLCHEVARDPRLAGLGFTDLSASGLVAAHHRARLTTAVAERLRALTPPRDRPSLAVVEASVAGAWAILQHQMSTGSGGQVTEAAPLVAQMLTAPTLGGGAANPGHLPASG